MREYLFLHNKIKRQIDWNGQSFTFMHQTEDKYHRHTDPVEVELSGVYHQATSYQQKNSDSGSVTTTKPRPMILCLWEDAARLSIGDTVTLNDKDYFVSGIENIQELSVGGEISLEVNE